MNIVSNVEVYGLDKSIIKAGYPMVIDIEEYLAQATVEDREKTANILAGTDAGEGHDNFLRGIIVQFDLNFTLAAWKQMQRYTFMNFVSSTSTMHRIKSMDIAKQCNEHVSDTMVEELMKIVEAYHENPTKENEMAMYYNIPTGFRLMAGMSTNYLQLKTIYQQRRNHYRLVA